MIQSIPNPPMGVEDIIQFRNNLEKHLKGEYSLEEKKQLEMRKARVDANVKRIIDNCGGKNPILGY